MTHFNLNGPLVCKRLEYLAFVADRIRRGLTQLALSILALRYLSKPTHFLRRQRHIDKDCSNTAIVFMVAGNTQAQAPILPSDIRTKGHSETQRSANNAPRPCFCEYARFITFSH